VTQPVAFTCLLPVYGGDEAAFFREAVDSIDASVLAPVEVVICQDGDLPSDLAAQVAVAVRAGARVAVNAGPRGLHHNLNNALRQVKTSWIARCDADDINAPDRFLLQASHLAERPDIGVLGGDLIEFWPDGRTRSKVMPLDHADLVAWAQWRSPVNHNTVFYRAEDVLAVGGYPDLPFKEDYALWLKMIARGVHFANLRADLVRARLGEGFYGRRAGARNFASEWQVYRLKRDIPALAGAGALAALAARSAILASGPLTSVVYNLALRH
jgi:glycosyltransferase involved in cell wall biosynthesis